MKRDKAVKDPNHIRVGEPDLKEYEKDIREYFKKHFMRAVSARITKRVDRPRMPKFHRYSLCVLPSGNPGLTESSYGGWYDCEEVDLWIRRYARRYRPKYTY